MTKRTGCFVSKGFVIGESADNREEKPTARIIEIFIGQGHRKDFGLVFCVFLFVIGLL